MTSVQKLVAKLRAAGWKIPDEYSFQRCYPDHWRRADGAWLWSIRWNNGEVGSPDRVRDLLRANGFARGPWNEIYCDD